MPIKDRNKFLNYQREYNKKRKEGCRNLHPESENSSSQAPERRPKQQGVTNSHTSQMAGCKTAFEKSSGTSIKTITNNTHLRTRGKHVTATARSSVVTPSIPCSLAAKMLDFSQLKIKRPIQIVGAVDRFRSLDEIVESVGTGHPISGEELARLRRAGAKI
jgi:hypothetical protein